AAGRLAEILGPLAAPLDHVLLALDVTRAVPVILASLPETTRNWLDAFVSGINHHLASAAPPPFEFRLLGIAPALWRIGDVPGIPGRRAADVSWLIWQRLLPSRDREEWPEIWAQLPADGTLPSPRVVTRATDLPQAFTRLVLGFGRAGSNAVAVASRRSAT